MKVCGCNIGESCDSCNKPDALPVVALQRHTRGPNGSIYPATNGEFVLWVDVAQRDAELSELRDGIECMLELHKEGLEVHAQISKERDTLKAELAAMRAAAQTVLTGLNERIDHSVANRLPTPIFEGIADLHAALDGVTVSAPSQVAFDNLVRRAADVVEGLHGENLPGALPVRIQKLKAALENAALLTTSQVAAEAVQVPRELAEELLAELSPKNPVSKALRTLLATSQGEA